MLTLSLVIVVVCAAVVVGGLIRVASGRGSAPTRRSGAPGSVRRDGLAYLPEPDPGQATQTDAGHNGHHHSHHCGHQSWDGGSHHGGHHSWDGGGHHGGHHDGGSSWSGSSGSSDFGGGGHHHG
ncbi:hypothetical protein [Streptacidiphilus neutrinimicus]|uniref:hypothetical protein n=1 Tax=Streptacidiphilus neutrinimicus TaxID=105420 RepID=UPI000693C1E9|nr:hypothetical protein [Streptacidiphilus neutrinimicus]